MKSVSVVKVGNLRDPDPAKRGQVQGLDVPEQPVGDEDVKIKAFKSIDTSILGFTSLYVKTSGAFGFSKEKSLIYCIFEIISAPVLLLIMINCNCYTLLYYI